MRRHARALVGAGVLTVRKVRTGGNPKDVYDVLADGNRGTLDGPPQTSQQTFT